MLNFSHKKSGRLCDGMARRDFLKVGSVGSMALGLPQLLRAESQARGKNPKAKAKSVILFFLQGGQSHIDTFDMKPDSPDGIRGDFKPMPTKVPGFHICEHLPKLAARADKYAVIRSMTHKASNHNPGCYYALSGVAPTRDIVALQTSPSDYPHPGAVVSKLKPLDKPLPTFVQLSPSLVGDSRTQVPGQNAGFLSAAYDPLKVTADPNEPGFNVSELALPKRVSLERFGRRRSLLQTVEEEFPLIGELPELRKMDTFYKRAYDLVTSPMAKKAFDISREKESLRDAYGRNRYGQQLLLARRLVESGVRLVSLYWGGPLNAPDDYWDTHRGNFTKQKNKLLPWFDQCFSALLDDLEGRGILDETLVIAMGEFGRTPRIGQVTANAGTDATGRDHWPRCYHLLMAGGGVTGGAVLGASDAYGAYPTERPTTPEDITATVYSALGIDPHTEVHDSLGRPLPISRGEPVAELFA